MISVGSSVWLTAFALFWHHCIYFFNKGAFLKSRMNLHTPKVCLKFVSEVFSASLFNTCWLCTCHCFSKTNYTNLNVSMFLWLRRVDGDKGGGHCALSTGKWERRKRQSRFRGVFRGSFIHLSLSSYDKGQALTKAEVRSGSVTSSWPDRPS